MSSDPTTPTGSAVAGGTSTGELTAERDDRSLPGRDPGAGPAVRPGGPGGSGRSEESVESGESGGRRWAAAVGMVAVGGIVLVSLAIVGLAASRASILSPPSRVAFPGWMAGPLGWIGRSIRPGQATLKLILSCAVGAMFVGYLVVLSCASRMPARWAIGGVVVLQVIFFLSPPLSLTDVFNYMNYGRMEILHGLNPYTTIPALGPPSDPTFLLSNWHQLLSPYGPLFTIFSFAIVPFGVAVGFWVLKASLMIASLATLWLVWRCAELVGRDPLSAVVFVGLNPLVLVWGVGGDHNDFLMVCFVMLAFYLLLRARAARAAGDGGGGEARADGDGGGGEARADGDGGGGEARADGDGGAGEARADGDGGGGEARKAGAGAGAGREFGAGFALVAAVAIKASAGILLPVVLLGAGRRFRLLGGMIGGRSSSGGRRCTHSVRTCRTSPSRARLSRWPGCRTSSGRSSGWGVRPTR